MQAFDARRYQTQSTKAITPTITLSCISNKEATNVPMAFTPKPLKQTADLDLDVTILKSVSSSAFQFIISYADIFDGKIDFKPIPGYHQSLSCL